MADNIALYTIYGIGIIVGVLLYPKNKLVGAIGGVIAVFVLLTIAALLFAG